MILNDPIVNCALMAKYSQKEGLMEKECFESGLAGFTPKILFEGERLESHWERLIPGLEYVAQANFNDFKQYLFAETLDC